MGKETGEPLVSRLTDLIALAKAKDPDLGIELEREFEALFPLHTPYTLFN